MCHSVFDDDYRKRHEQTCHQGKRVQVAHQGAPANPFTAAAANKSRSIQAGQKLLLKDRIAVRYNLSLT